MLAVRDITLGSVAETDLMTLDGVVIVQQNEQIEEHHLAALRDSGVDYLIPRPQADMETVRATAQSLAHVVMGRIEMMIKRGEYLRAPAAREPPRPTSGGGAPQEILNLNGVQLMRRRLSSRLQPVYGMLETGKSPDLKILDGITKDLLDLMESEPRQFSQLALMTQRREDYLPDHAISVAVLAMAMAAQMGLSAEHVKEIIVGALLADVGMLMVPKRIRVGTGMLTEGDRQRVQQHPILSLSMMEQVPGLSPIPRIVGYQHHERLNGTGYPIHAAEPTISDFARIITVADIYAASTNPRSYKSSKLPYSAMEELVHMAHRGLLDVRTVKALLSAVGLFPVGSFVLLSNGLTAQVIGANATRIDRPLLLPMEASGLPGSLVVDLSERRHDHLKIVRSRALAGAGGSRARGPRWYETAGGGALDRGGRPDMLTPSDGSPRIRRTGTPELAGPALDCPLAS